MEGLVQTIRTSALRLLGRHGFLRDEGGDGGEDGEALAEPTERDRMCATFLWRRIAELGPGA